MIEPFSSESACQTKLVRLCSILIEYNLCYYKNSLTAIISQGTVQDQTFSASLPLQECTQPPKPKPRRKVYRLHNSEEITGDYQHYSSSRMQSTSSELEIVRTQVRLVSLHIHIAQSFDLSQLMLIQLLAVSLVGTRVSGRTYTEEV